MSQLTMELNHINRIRKEVEGAYRKGEMNRFEFLDYDLKYLTQSSNRIGNLVSLTVSAAKHGIKVKNMAEKQNLISNNEAIYTGDPALEMIKCADMDDKIISREACLSFSEESKNIEQCKSCENFKITRDYLLPKSQQVTK